MQTNLRKDLLHCMPKSQKAKKNLSMTKKVSSKLNRRKVRIVMAKRVAVNVLAVGMI